MDADAARPTLRLTWISAAFGCAATALAAGIGADARWLAAVGAAIVHAGALPHSIPYAAAPSDWHDAPALGQLIFHGLETLLGDKGLLVAQLAAVAIALGALAADMRRAQARDGAGAAVLAAVVVAAPASFLVVRAQLFSLALFPVLVLLIRNDARHPSRRIWLSVPLLLVWANLHGGVLIGFAVLTAYLALCRLRGAPLEAAALLAAAGVSLLATPALLGTIHYYTGVLGGAAAASGYGLWAPLSIGEPLDVLYIAVAVPLLLAGLRRRPAVWELVLLLALAAMSVDARRNGIWFLLFVATPAARGLTRPAAQGILLNRRLGLLCACIPVAMIALGLVRTPAPNGATPRLVDATLAVAGGTPILADPLDAEQLALGGHRVWIGNPLDAFAQTDQRLYLEWLNGTPTGDAILGAPIRAVLVRRGSAAQLRLAAGHRFREVERDAHAVLYAGRS